MNQDILLHPSIDMSKVRPIEDHVLIKMIPREKTPGGMWLPKSKGTECALGEVVSTGPGIYLHNFARYAPLELFPGDKVITMEYMGEHVNKIESKYRLVRSNGIWAKVEYSGEATFDFSSLEPRFDCILLRPQEEEKSSGGIWFANSDPKEQCRIASVVKVGPGKWDSDTGERRQCEVKESQLVLYTRYAGADVTVCGEKLRLCQESDIKSALEG